MAVKLRGNPDHPYSRGELCPKVNRFLDRVYSPDRVLTPLVRVGPKGEGRFEPASWDDALSLVADQPPRDRRPARRRGRAALVGRRDPGAAADELAGSPVLRPAGLVPADRLAVRCHGRRRGRRHQRHGRGADPTDVRCSKLVLLWGTNTKLTNRHLWPFIEEARAGGATVVVIDPIRTATAEAADWFVQPLPGTDVALMLAMMHVLVRDDLIDHEYVDRPHHRLRRAVGPRGRVDTRAGRGGVRSGGGGDRAAGPRLRHHPAGASSAR